MFTSLMWRCGQWCIAPNGIPQFDGCKDIRSPRPAVIIDSYGGFLRLLGRSTKPNDDLTHKLEHSPHRGICSLGLDCWINEPGYVSTRQRDVWKPLPRDIEKHISCFEPDDQFVEKLFDSKDKLT